MTEEEPSIAGSTEEQPSGSTSPMPHVSPVHQAAGSGSADIERRRRGSVEIEQRRRGSVEIEHKCRGSADIEHKRRGSADTQRRHLRKLRAPNCLPVPRIKRISATFYNCEKK